MGGPYTQWEERENDKTVVIDYQPSYYMPAMLIVCLICVRIYLSY